MSQEDLELFRMLARFKLQLRRLHDRAVDLSALEDDAEYAARTLAEVEELTDDEELLILVLQLRERLLRPKMAAAVELAVRDETPAARVPAARDYRFGARGG